MATNRNVLAVIPFFFCVAVLILQSVSAGLGARDDAEGSSCDTYRTCKFMQVCPDDLLVEGSHGICYLSKIC